MFDFLKPRYLKEGKILLKGVKKFLDYKEDILPQEKLDNIREARDKFATALKSRDKEQCGVLAKDLTTRCETALPRQSQPGLRENVEVFFVAIVVAVGIRTYFLQPFKIPTGSMQPTLNGIVSTPQWEPDASGALPDQPGLLTKLGHFVWYGRNYVELHAPKDGIIVGGYEKTIARFFTFTYFQYDDGSTFKVYSPLNKLLGDQSSNGGLEEGTGLGLAQVGKLEIPRGTKTPEFRISSEVKQVGNKLIREPFRVKKGDILARGYVDTGDQVLVNKVAYHFRSPKRGEVFVFTTKDISGIRMPNPGFGSQHYIKRLTGVPGDSLTVEGTDLLINGKKATEPGIARVMSMQNGYEGYGDPRVYRMLGTPVVDKKLGDKHYFAMGDNSFHSSDSRTWGPVPEKNVVGPGLFVYFPFGHHFGSIE